MRCRGYRFGVAKCGIKQSGALDIGVIASDTAASVAAVFTQNRAKAAPVTVSQALLKAAKGKMTGIVVNSGNANACTGPEGQRDASAMAAWAARGVGAARGSMLVASTGVIGKYLPMDKVEAGIASATATAGPGKFADFAKAILTTDKRPKTFSRKVAIGGQSITLLGCTKGAGMIAPNMATTLTFLVTDAAIAPAQLRAVLKPAVDETFNAIVVDGDTSTNDMVAVFANGTGKKLAGKNLATFQTVLTAALRDLAAQLVRDAEGSHHLVEIVVCGGKSVAQARAAAHAVATSPLVKTAIAGGDANWGRIVAAAGRSGADMRMAALDVTIGNVRVVANGVPVPKTEARAEKIMAKREYSITIDLGVGVAVARCLACDLSHDYVTINADYRT